MRNLKHLKVLSLKTSEHSSIIDYLSLNQKKLEEINLDFGYMSELHKLIWHKQICECVYDHMFAILRKYAQIIYFMKIFIKM